MKVKGFIRVEKYRHDGLQLSVVSDDMAGRGTFFVPGVDPSLDFVTPIPFEFELKEKGKEAEAPIKKNGKGKKE